MNTTFRSGENSAGFKLLVLVSMGLLSLAAQGQATVDPTSEPFLTLAPYVLKSSNLEARPGNETGGTFAYRPWFENGAWTGDIIQYVIDKDGNRIGPASVGNYPLSGIDWRGAQELWSARYKFPDWDAANILDQSDDGWECIEEDADYWWEERNVVTFNSPATVDFFWDKLTAGQRAALDPATAENEGLDDDYDASSILNFIRGDRSRELCKNNGIHRWRWSILGAIVNSRPVFVPVGNDGVVVVGANDGMVHGFSATDGKELFSYVPSMLIDKLRALRDPLYRPTHFVDGEFRHRDIGTVDSPKHIVAGGFGAGAKGLFVLEVDPSTPKAVKVLREISGTAADHVSGVTDTQFGHIHGRPSIARLPDGTPGGAWYVVTGNGYGAADGLTRLLLIPINGGDVRKIEIETGFVGNGLSAPALLDSSGNGIVDYAYAGDLAGNLWRFDFNKYFNNGERGKLLFASNDVNKPITAEPDIADHPDNQGGFMIYFGTGSLLSADDIDSSPTTRQSVYGIWDRLGSLPGNGLPVSDASNRLLTTTLLTYTGTWAIPEDDTFCQDPDPDIQPEPRTVRLVASTTPAGGPTWSGDNSTLGWRVNLPRDGERLLGRPQVRAERLQFITTNPYDMVDEARALQEGSGSWMLQLDLATGGNARQPRPLFDLNRNCALDTGDGLAAELQQNGYTIPEGTFPVGVNIGPYNVAQPAFARVQFNPLLRSVVDGVYINALQLPIVDPKLPPPLGPIDVTTDSAFGQAHGGVDVDFDEPAKEPFPSGQGQQTRLFLEASGPTKPFVKADGLGHRVDGHSFAYNWHHGVPYVDFFDLEPQRDDWRLDFGAVYLDENGDYVPMTPRESKQELNRVTEVGIGANQRFIVMLTNADLSQRNEITIGCDTWPVYEYQTMMMQILRGDDPMKKLEDERLIFTLEGDWNPIRKTPTAACPEPTLRITPRIPAGESLAFAMQGTLPGCVNNTDKYVGGTGQNSHKTRKSELNPDGSFQTGGTPEDLYATTPHVTMNNLINSGFSGYRWRNGALTMQLLAVPSEGMLDFALLANVQDEADWPKGVNILEEGEMMGWGGAYARAFTIEGNTVKPIHPGTAQPEVAISGMLYEASIFWHWGDMTRYQQEGRPNNAACVGVRQNSELMWETSFFAKYTNLTGDITLEDQQRYADLLAEIRSGINLEKNLQELSDWLASRKDIAEYHRLRHYVPNMQQGQNLLALDRGLITPDLASDGTPVEVIDIEADLLPSLGPNYQPGRRSWIDLTPEE